MSDSSNYFSSLYNNMISFLFCHVHQFDAPTVLRERKRVKSMNKKMKTKEFSWLILCNNFEHIFIVNLNRKKCALSSLFMRDRETIFHFFSVENLTNKLKIYLIYIFSPRSLLWYNWIYFLGIETRWAIFLSPLRSFFSINFIYFFLLTAVLNSEKIFLS